MSKLSKEEIAARRKRMQEEALKSIAKTQQLNIRVDENSITRLYNLAAKQSKPVGTMVREWILDRLLAEEQPDRGEPMQVLVGLVSDLHARIDRWDDVLLGEHALCVKEVSTAHYKLGRKRPLKKTKSGD
jgi:hypothetical protein